MYDLYDPMAEKMRPEGRGEMKTLLAKNEFCCPDEALIRTLFPMLSGCSLCRRGLRAYRADRKTAYQRSQ